MRCPLCTVPVGSLKEYRRHLLSEHIDCKIELWTGGVLCPQCQCKYSSWNSTYKHYKRVHCNMAVPHVTSSSSMESVVNVSDGKVTSDGGEGSEQLYDTSLDTSLTHLLTKHTARYYGNIFIPRKVVPDIFDTFKAILCSGIVPEIERQLRSNVGENCLESVQRTLDDVFKPFRSEFQLMKLFRNRGSFLEPLPYVVGERSDFFVRDKNKTFGLIDCMAHRIPLRAVFERFFSVENVLFATIDYMETLIKDNSGIVQNFVQASFWRSKIAKNPDKKTIPYTLFYDDFEAGNPLGSRSGVHKLGAIYIAFPCLAVDLPSGRFVSSSALNKIILVALFHTSDRVQFGNRAILDPIIEELNKLKSEGINFQLPNFSGTVYFELGLILGDNLGIHSLCGFVESFSANRCCRACRVGKDQLRKDTVENPDLLRNSVNYALDLAEGDASATGVKDESVWFSLNDFDLFSQLGFDVMHDIFEGCGKYIMGVILREFIVKRRYFTIGEFNERLQGFDFGADNSSKPVGIAIENIRKETVRQSASGMANFIRYFGVLIGDLVPSGDNFWALYESLYRVVDLVMSRVCLPEYSDLLKCLISDMNELYIELKGPLKPKFHFLVHYPRALSNFGPLHLLSSMRFEAKHRTFKHAANVSASRVNLTLTLARKHQLLLNYLFINGFVDPMETSCLKPCSYSTFASVLTMSNVKIDGNLDNVRKANWISYQSHRYRHGTVLVTHMHEDRYTFMQITTILIFERNQFVFVGKYLHNVAFDPQLFAYEVETAPNRKVAFALTDLLSPVPCTLTANPAAGTAYVIIRET